MRLLRRLLGYARIARGARRNRSDYYRWLVRRPALLLAVNTYEAAVLASNRVEPRLKYLASLKASSLVGCPF
jgi:alkylhydroperoxidase family enzyme